MDSLIGTWKLLSYEAYSVKSPDEFIYPTGKVCKGILMYSIDGSHMQQPNQAKYESSDLNGGTEAELVETTRRYFEYTGEFYLDESGRNPF